MPLVNVMVNARAYTIACDDGEEEHLRDLAAMVDAKAREVLGSVGQVGDSRLILMAALLLADEHHALTAQLETAERAAQAPVAAPQGISPSDVEDIVAEALEAAAARVETLAASLTNPGLTNESPANEGLAH